MLYLAFYLLLTSGLCVAAAGLLEPLVRSRGLPTRILWPLAIVASLVLVGLPAGRPAMGSTAGLSSSDPSWSAVQSAPVSSPGPRFEAATPVLTSVAAAVHSDNSDFDAAVVVLWGAWALAGLALLFRGHLRLHRLRRGWRPAEAAGARLLVSPDSGPAVVGLLDPQIVVPAWFLELGEPAQRLVIVHEREHMRAADPMLLLGSTLLARVAPWNPAFAFALARLRDAIELDCDARVLRSHSDAGAYCRLLLNVGERTVAGVAPSPGLAEPAAGLERRIQVMTTKTRTTRTMLAGAAAAVVMLVTACQTPRPGILPVLSLEMILPGPSAAVAGKKLTPRRAAWVETASRADSTPSGAPALASSELPSRAPAPVPALDPVHLTAGSNPASPLPILPTWADTALQRRNMRRALASAKRVERIADSVIRASYPELMRRSTGSPRAILVLILDEQDRPTRHAVSLDADLPERLSAVVRRLGVDTMSARSRQLGLIAREQWNLAVGYVVEGPGPVHGTTKMEGWWKGGPKRHSAAPAAAVAEPAAVPFQHLVDSVAHARTPEAFTEHTGTFEVAVLLTSDGGVSAYAAGQRAHTPPRESLEEAMRRMLGPEAQPTGVQGGMLFVLRPSRTAVYWGVRR